MASTSFDDEHARPIEAPALERELAALVGTLHDRPGAAPDAALASALLSAAVVAYARSRQGSDAQGFVTTRPLSRTDVALAVTALLRAVDLEPFEISLWRAWGEPPPPAGGPRGSRWVGHD